MGLFSTELAENCREGGDHSPADTRPDLHGPRQRLRRCAIGAHGGADDRRPRKRRDPVRSKGSDGIRQPGAVLPVKIAPRLTSDRLPPKGDDHRSNGANYSGEEVGQESKEGVSLGRGGVHQLPQTGVRPHVLARPKRLPSNRRHRTTPEMTKIPPDLAIGRDLVNAPELTQEQSAVDLWGFEPQTPSMRTRCATRLRHRPLRRVKL